jgi:4-amino-4-deoxy-L-arabinose transferase-like glycosyltransferase
VNRLVSLVVWFGLLFALWTVFTGTALTLEVLYGLGAAGLGALLAEVLRSRGLLAFDLDARLLARVWKLAWQVPLDQVLVAWTLVRALVRGRRVRGEWVRAPFPTETGARGAWQRAFGTVTGTASPNAIVVDYEGDHALLHSLEPRVTTGRSVL